MRLNYIDNMDCTEGLAQIPDGSVDLLLTDIPFNISRDNNFKTMGRHGIDFGQWDRNFNEACLAKFVPKIKPGGSALVFHAFEQFDAVRFALQDLHLKDKLIWQKTNPMPRNRDRRYIGNIEMFSWYVRPGGKWTFNRQCDTYDGSVLVYPTESGGAFKRYHPTQKSLGLITELVKRHSAAGAVVLDPFMGSGTTAVACIRTGRNYIGFELDEKYHAAALGRIAAETEEDDAWML